MTSTFEDTEAVITSDGADKLAKCLDFIKSLRGLPAGWRFSDAGVLLYRQLPNGTEQVAPILGSSSFDALAPDLISWMQSLDDETFAKFDRPRDHGSDSWWHKDGFTITVEPYWQGDLWATITPKWHLIGK